MTPVYLFVRIIAIVLFYRGDFAISKKPRLNTAIRSHTLRVIDKDGNQIGVLTRDEALRTASDQELDLVEISPNANPPVAKIIDWGKFNYQRTKQLQKNKRKSKVLEVKQMRFGLKIGDHDLAVKLNKVKNFLEDGHKVKLSVFYRGRELAHKDIGFRLVDKVLGILGDTAIVEQEPQLSGKQLSLVVRNNPSAKSSKQYKQLESDELDQLNLKKPQEG